MRRRSEKHSIEWEGIVFVRFSGRPRQTLTAIELDRVYALCPGNPPKVAVTRLDSLFQGSKIDSYLPEALHRLGAIELDRRLELEIRVKEAEEKDRRGRMARDLKNAIEETDCYDSGKQEKLIKEFFPDWEVKS